ncbi:hypothetical protein JCM9279_000179 [Rhodotorula babjevae]
MPPRTRSSYAPLPAAIPLVLAPASPLPPTFDSDVLHSSHALADVDKLRRQTGLRHAAPAALGLPQLVSTGVCGRWGNGDDDHHDQAPPWVLAAAPRSKDDRKRDKAERRAWDQLGVAGIPRDEVEADEWELVKRKWRTKSRHDKAHKVKAVVEAHPSSSGDSKKSAPVLSAHFPSSKSSVAASSGSKKRPPSSPPAAHSPSSPPGPRSTDADVKPVVASSNRPPHSASFPSLSSINSAGRGLASPAPRRTSSTRALVKDVEDGVLSDGEGDEVLYERGCTQMVLPDPTPSAAVPSARLPRTSTTSIASSIAAPAAAPFSSPGLRPSAPISGAGIAISTPHALSRPPSAAPLPSPSASPRLSPHPHPPAHTRSSSPPSTVKAPARRSGPPSRATTAVSSLSVPLGPAAPPGGAQQALHRLSSIARTGSVLSGRSAEREGDEGTWEGFLEADAQD